MFLFSTNMTVGGSITYPIIEQDNALKIYSGEFEFDSPYWDEISVDAKEFIRQLMCVDVDKRLSCEEALEHAW